MDSLTTDFWDILLWSFWFFIWISALFIWIRCIFDLFSDKSLSGWAKAAWAVFLIVIPWIGAIVYLIVRSRSMRERQEAAIADMQARQEQYIQRVAGSSRSSAEQIADAKALLDSGAITQSEFETLKAKVLA